MTFPTASDVVFGDELLVSHNPPQSGMNRPVHTSSLGIRNGPHLLVGLEDIRDRSGTYNAKWVQHENTHHVMLLDMLELGRVSECRDVPV